MKFRLVLMLACALLVSTAATASTRQGAFALKAGYFTSFEDEGVPAQYDIEIDDNFAFGAEYYALTRGDSAYSVALFYTEPDVSGTIWDGAAWQPVSADSRLWQISANYYRFAKNAEMGFHKYEGFFYGAGLGYSDVRLDSVSVGAVSYNVKGLGDNSADVNLILGYKWSEGIGLDLKWIPDEEAVTLMAGWWWGD